MNIGKYTTIGALYLEFKDRQWQKVEYNNGSGGKSLLRYDDEESQTDKQEDGDRDRETARQS